MVQRYFNLHHCCITVTSFLFKYNLRPILLELVTYVFKIVICDFEITKCGDSKSVCCKISACRVVTIVSFLCLLLAMQNDICN